MHTFGVSVNRPYIPVSIELSEDKNVLEDVDAYPVKVCHFQMLSTMSLTTVQVVLRRIDDDKSDSEVVHAKFVIGADGQ
jgi:phenol 2-monooxygenase